MFECSNDSNSESLFILGTNEGHEKDSPEMYQSSYQADTFNGHNLYRANYIKLVSKVILLNMRLNLPGGSLDDRSDG